MIDIQQIASVQSDITSKAIRHSLVTPMESGYKA